MSDFIKKYLPIYLLWLFFISFVAVGLQVSTGTFSAELPTGSDFTTDWLSNTLGLFWNILTFRSDGFPALLATLCFYVPSIPIVIWLIEAIISFLDAVIPL